MKIKAYVSYCDFTKTHFYKNFEIAEEMPTIGEEFNNETITEIEEVRLDSEQGNDEVYSFKYFKIMTKDDEGEEWDYYLAVKIKGMEM